MTRCGVHRQKFSAAPVTMDMLTTLYQTGSAIQRFTDKASPQVGATLNYFPESFLGGKHELQGGFSYGHLEDHPDLARPRERKLHPHSRQRRGDRDPDGESSDRQPRTVLYPPGT
jgi:hypothetical protein